MAEVPANEFSEGKEFEANFAVGAGPTGNFHTPIHETLTLAALIASGYNVAQGTSLSSANNGDWEYLRGVVWNDDPAGLLFDDTPNKNHKYSLAAKWLSEFERGKKEWASDDSRKMKNATGRSHWGDLQFLHCMASKPGELPTETKRKVMIWLEVLWKLANKEDGITPDTILSETALIELCPNSSLPPNWKPLSFLLGCGSTFAALDTQRRALGSIFHFIQDSYALGHTRRVLLNPEHKISDNPLKFQPGIADRWGAIENFHVYDGQDKNLHSYYDHSDVPIPNPTNLSNLDQFNGLIGCREAVNKCMGFIRLKQAGKTWETGVRAYLDREIFPLSPNAQPANTQVWP